MRSMFSSRSCAGAIQVLSQGDHPTAAHSSCTVQRFVRRYKHQHLCLSFFFFFGMVHSQGFLSLLRTPLPDHASTHGASWWQAAS